MGEIALAESARLLSDDVELRLPTAGRRRFAVAVGVSAVVHAIVLLAVVALGRWAEVTKPIVVLPISLVSLPGGGGGDGTPAPGSPASEIAPVPETPPATAPPRAVPGPVPGPVVRHKPVARPKPTTQPRPSAAVANPTDSAMGGETAPAGGGGEAGGGGGIGGGSGGGGGGSAASPAYGSNPQPPYPMAARRMGLEGTVVLRVVVAADGRPASVTVLQSSGHAVLDTSALETVRTRWRFVPARRNGIPVEDSVQVPIRFRQTAG